MIFRYVAGLLLALLVASGLRIWWLQHELAKDAQTISDQAHGLTVYQSANRDQATAIKALQSANRAWAFEAEVNRANADTLAQQAEEYRRQLLATPRPRDTAPDCLAMESLPMSICPMRAEQIRRLLP